MTPAPPPIGKHGPIVYFIRESHEGQIKIGTTTNYDARRRQLATSTSAYLKLLHWEPGGEDHEAYLHAKFRRYRVRPDREWFYPAEPVLEYIRNPPLGRRRPSVPVLPWRQIARALGIAPTGAWTLATTLLLWVLHPPARRRRRTRGPAAIGLLTAGLSATLVWAEQPWWTIAALALAACLIAGAVRMRTSR